MNRLKAGAFGCGLFAGAISTWMQPYNQLEIMGVDFRIIMAIAAVVLSFLYKIITRAGTVATGLYVSYGILAALLLRIFFDVIRDPTQHNLWPLEVAIFAVIAFPSALIGAYLAELLKWSSGK